MNNKALSFAAVTERSGPFKFGESVPLPVDLALESTKSEASSFDGEFKVIFGILNLNFIVCIIFEFVWLMDLGLSYGDRIRTSFLAQFDL